MSEEEIGLEVLRYRPESDAAPSFECYRVPYHDDWVVLDALNHVKDHLDGTLSYRWSCHMGICGSCGMMLNGEPMLACSAFLRDFRPGPIRVEPLANFAIERDLVVAIDDFMAKLGQVKPYIIPGKERAADGGEHLQTPLQLERFKQYTLCINCLLCCAACPQYGLKPEFLGPSALALAHRYNLDSRDHGRAERRGAVAGEAGVWDCTFVGACSEACPKGVDPAAAIQQAKVASVVDWVASLLAPRAKR
jgi:fumarate reductase iron-sulfur subunit